MTHTVSETLDLAADTIEQRGWVRGAWGGDTGPLCIEGGIIAALGQDFGATNLQEFWDCPAYVAVCNHLGLSDAREPNGSGFPVPADPLWRWNDSVAQNRLDVIGVLRSAAAAERAKEQAAVAAAESVADSFHRSLDRALAVTS